MEAVFAPRPSPDKGDVHVRGNSCLRIFSCFPTFLIPSLLSMAITVTRPKLTWSEKIYLPAIIGGMAITFRHLKNMLTGRTKVTMQYPEQKWDSHMPDHYRGAPALVKDEKDRVRCVACQLCEFICPPRAIRIVPGEIAIRQSVCQGGKISGGIRHRHDPLHLLRHV